jgi:hypothetical protein
VHVPLWQVSVRVQALPSLQVVPLALAGLEHTPVVGLQVPASWHWSLAVQTTGLLPVHVPLWQVSLCVQALPSLQVAPSGAFRFEHAPVRGLQVPATWHWSLAVQTTGLLPVHAPLWQVSLCVQALPSLQVAPLALAGLEHAPLAASQVPTSWHWSLAVQTTGLVPVHVPFWQVSVCVQALPSLQLAPSGAFGFEHRPVVGSQVPTLWHTSCAVQVTGGVVWVQVPLWQVLMPLHLLPSSQSVSLEHWLTAPRITRI